MDSSSSTNDESLKAVPSPNDSSKSPRVNTNPTKIKTLSGIFKVCKQGPVFRIVDPYKVPTDAKFIIPPPNPKSEGKDETKTSDCLYVNLEGPQFYKIKNPMITQPILARNLSKVFKDFPIHGAPSSCDKLEEFQRKKLLDFMGAGVIANEFEALEKYCSPNNLRTGKELNMASSVPSPGFLTQSLQKDSEDDATIHPKGCSSNSLENMTDAVQLRILDKLQQRLARDEGNRYLRYLKYRGVKVLPVQEMNGEADQPPDLVPGQDTLFRVRMYRPFHSAHNRGRRAVFDCDIILCGRQPLTELRDKITCRNDMDMRMDVSENPDQVAGDNITAKSAFPSGFLFINNVFYTDTRGRSADLSETPRRWASARGFGDFAVADMARACLQDVPVRTAHPDVYVHQGNCEHLFIISEIRLLTINDPLHLSSYPCHSLVSQNQTIYCTTCAEYGARWLVTDSNRVPFDPAYFCEMCFKQYMYKDGKKIGEFKAYVFKGNEMNALTRIQPVHSNDPQGNK